MLPLLRERLKLHLYSVEKEEVEIPNLTRNAQMAITCKQKTSGRSGDTKKNSPTPAHTLTILRMKCCTQNNLHCASQKKGGYGRAGGTPLKEGVSLTMDRPGVHS